MNPDRSALDWIEARKRHHLSHAHVQMARELGMNPRKLGKIDNHQQEGWKAPLPQFIEQLFEKRFGKPRPDVVMSVEQRLAAQRKKEEERRARKRLARDSGGAEATPAQPKASRFQVAVDERPEVRDLFANLKASRKQLTSLLMKYSGELAYEDPVYRLYHQSFKVFGLQDSTVHIVAALQALAPDLKLNPWFRQIVSEGTGKTFDPEQNQRWTEVTRPIVEAFLHARFFLEMAVRYGKTLQVPPRVLPSGWAALLYLYELR